jgi:hypothetical protein
MCVLHFAAILGLSFFEYKHWSSCRRAAKEELLQSNVESDNIVTPLVREAGAG